jgi:hypothetical protein
MFHHHKVRCRRAFAVLAVPAAAAAVLLGTAACGGSSVPPSAASVLKADGYTFRLSQAQLVALGGARGLIPAKYKPYVTGYSVGVKKSGSGEKVEVVFILTPAGAAKVTKSDLAGTGQGYTATLSGDVLRLNATESGGGS